MITRRPAPAPPVVGPETPVTICQLEDEMNVVLDIYRLAAPSRVLEIGTASGGTLFHWLVSAKPTARVVTVELELPDYPLDEQICRSWVPSGVELEMVTGDSHDPRTIVEIEDHGPFDWIFIDANHRYEHVAADVSAYWPMLADDGYLLLHDIALRRRYDDGTEAGVWKLWRELQAVGCWTREIRAAPDLNEYGIGIIRGRGEHVLKMEDLTRTVFGAVAETTEEPAPDEPAPDEPEPEEPDSE